MLQLDTIQCYVTLVAKNIYTRSARYCYMEVYIDNNIYMRIGGQFNDRYIS